MAKTPTPAADAVEPLGKVRRSQLISTYGIGAIVDLEKGSFMPMGLEDWESATKLPSLTIAEPRLQAMLGVTHFRLAPVAEQVAGTREVVARATAPAVRFPEWHECPRCHRLGMENDPFELAPDMQLVCKAHSGRVIATPVRFVVACRRGHLSDFPWEWWAHRSRPGGVCGTPVLYLKSRGQSASLADLYVECKTCSKSGAPASQSMGNAFSATAMSGDSGCQGLRPWLYDRQQGCTETPRTIQRGASNVHFAVTCSALSIPPASEAASQIVQEVMPLLAHMPAESIDDALKGLAEQYDVPVETLLAAHRQLLNAQGAAVALTERLARADEYAALSENREDEVIAGVVPQFMNKVIAAPPGMATWFDLISAVSRLREVRALAGFSRIEPYPVSADRVAQAIIDGNVSPLSKTPRPWLPAAEIRGEGIFLRFRSEAIDQWIADNPPVAARAAALEQLSLDAANRRGYVRDYTVTPRLLLVHSFAHTLIRQISIDCGYSASSLRERLYVAEANTDLPPMNGVLIYTGSPDSEGSLGGLVRLADPNLLVPIFERTLHSAGWCGSDPVCLETDPAQSGDRVSGAACHCCILVPETACEKFNRELDRAMMVGEAEQAFPGYFESKDAPWHS